MLAAALSRMFYTSRLWDVYNASHCVASSHDDNFDHDVENNENLCPDYGIVKSVALQGMDCRVLFYDKLLSSSSFYFEWGFSFYG